MTAMHLFFALPPYFFLHRAHITVILYKQAWIGTAGVRGHVETEIVHDISFGGSKVNLTGNVLVKVQHGRCNIAKTGRVDVFAVLPFDACSGAACQGRIKTK